MLTATNPSTGRIIREVEAADRARMAAIMADAEGALAAWGEKSFDQRAQVLRAVASWMRDQVDELALPMIDEMGKPVREARAEVIKSAWCAEHYAEHAENYLATDELPSDATRSYVQYRPLGVILGILPWNAPFWLAFRFCAPALMAGNTCVMKHDPHVPGCAEAIASCFREAGAPQGIFSNLPLETPQVADAIKHPAIRGVSFTGSTRGGAAVASIAASEIKPSVLELGGSDPCIVLGDADLEKAAEVITLSRIINAGQSCIAAKRIIVEASVHDQLLDLLKQRLSALKVGDPRREETDIGPIARPDLREELHRQVRQTIDAGARCLLGGQLPEGDGYFYPVTLLADVDESMAAACEETFGPVAVVMKAADEIDALRMANRSEYGLAASIWSETARAEAMASKLETGQVAINGIVKTDPRLPSGGVKRSGYGRELGPHGIHAFVNAQQIWVGPATG